MIAAAISDFFPSVWTTLATLSAAAASFMSDTCIERTILRVVSSRFHSRAVFTSVSTRDKQTHETRNGGGHHQTVTRELEAKERGARRALSGARRVARARERASERASECAGCLTFYEPARVASERVTAAATAAIAAAPHRRATSPRRTAEPPRSEWWVVTRSGPQPPAERWPSRSVRAAPREGAARRRGVPP